MSPLRSALKTVVSGGRLSREESAAAFSAVVDGSEPVSLVAALLGALAARGEAAEEVAGVVDVLLARAARPPVSAEVAARAVDVCGTGGDGLGTFNVSTATAFVVAGAGVPVAKHGGRAVSSTCGSADVLAALGVDIEMSPALAAAALHEANVTFLFAPAYHGAMRGVAPLRRELGVRTIFNLAGPLSNPVAVTRQIVGVDRPERVEVIARALALRGATRALVFSNEAGGDELLPLGRTRVAEVRGGDVESSTLTARDFGLEDVPVGELAGGDVARNADILLAVLAARPGAALATVLMNAAAALVVSGRAATFRDGMEAARASVAEGAARRALAGLITSSRGSEERADAPVPGGCGGRSASAEHRAGEV